MKLKLFRWVLLLGWLTFPGAYTPPAAGESLRSGFAAPTPLFAQTTTKTTGKKESWWKEFFTWLDEYASSKTGMIQIGVLGVLLSLYVITRKDGPK